MSLTTRNSVGEFVVDRPARARVFERLGIDFCCGGKLSLAEACRRKGVDPDETLEALERQADIGAANPVEHMSLTEICDHIERTHHAPLRRELPRLRTMLRKVAVAHGLHHPWVHEMVEVYEPFEYDLLLHMETEERVVFPLIRSLEAEDDTTVRAALALDSPIAVMEHEHDGAGRALASLRALSNGFTAPPGACATFVAALDGLRELETDMHWHVHKENNVLFPRALALAGH